MRQLFCAALVVDCPAVYLQASAVQQIDNVLVKRFMVNVYVDFVVYQSPDNFLGDF